MIVVTGRLAVGTTTGVGAEATSAEEMEAMIAGTDALESVLCEDEKLGEYQVLGSRALCKTGPILKEGVDAVLICSSNENTQVV